jgi:hypothetical protein
MRLTLGLAIAFCAIGFSAASPPALAASDDAPIPVTPDNFARAESDLRFSMAVKNGGLGKFFHQRAPASLDKQTLPRAERDLLISTAVFDLDAGPVTITLPDPGQRYLSLQIVDEDGYTDEFDYGAGTHVLTKEKLGSRYGLAALRIAVDPDAPQDIAAANAFQDSVKVEQPNGPGVFQVPDWDAQSQIDVRTGLRVLAGTLPDTKGLSGARGKVDPVRRLIGAAVAWGAPPAGDVFVLDRTPADNSGSAVYRLTLKDVPVDGFWSVSVYNERGFFSPNAAKAYSLTSATAKPDPDGGYVLQFGGCEAAIANCLPTPPDWSLAVRLYRPKPAALDGGWTFPALTLVPQPAPPPLPPPQTVKAAPPIQGASPARQKPKVNRP